MDILSNFAERLKECMEEREIKSPTLAKAIGANRTTVSELLRGEYLPSNEHMIAIVDYFNCSADYLLGLEEFPKEKTFGKNRPFSESFSLCLKESKTSQYKFHKATGISYSVIYGWLHRGVVPTVTSIIALSKYFGVSVDFLLGRTD